MCGFACVGSGATRTNGVGIEHVSGSGTLRLLNFSEVLLLLFSWVTQVFWDMGGESVGREAEAVEAGEEVEAVTKLAFWIGIFSTNNLFEK